MQYFFLNHTQKTVVKRFLKRRVEINQVQHVSIYLIRDASAMFLRKGNMQGGEERGLGPRNDVLTTCKAVTLRGGQRIFAIW